MALLPRFTLGAAVNYNPAVAAWYDNFPFAEADSAGGFSWQGQMFGSKITAGATGNCTKVRLRVDTMNVNSGKIALLTSGGVILGSGTYAGAVSNDWTEATITGVAVTSGTVYFVIYCGSSVGSMSLRKRTSTNNGVENYDQIYSSFPTGTVSTVNTNNQLCVGLYIG